MFKTTVEKEWGEVCRNGFKMEDWSWTVTFFVDNKQIDQHYIKTEADATMAAALFEAGAFKYGEYGGPDFSEAFA